MFPERRTNSEVQAPATNQENHEVIKNRNASTYSKSGQEKEQEASVDGNSLTTPTKGCNTVILKSCQVLRYNR